MQGHALNGEAQTSRAVIQMKWVRSPSGAEVLATTFRDQWAQGVQFAKAPAILETMAFGLEQTGAAREEIRRKLGPDAVS
jgi:hypothetical protein